MKTRLAILALFTAAGFVVVGTGTARASCAAPPKGYDGPSVIFEGIAVEDYGRDADTYMDRFRFRVEAVERGALEPGDFVVAALAVDRPESGYAATSVSLGPAPVVGARYEVGAEPWDDPDGQATLWANVCDGFLNRLDGTTLVNDVPDDPTVVVTNSGSEVERPAPDSDLAAVSGPAEEPAGDGGQVELLSEPAASEGQPSDGAMKWLAAALLGVVGTALAFRTRAGRVEAG